MEGIVIPHAVLHEQVDTRNWLVVNQAVDTGCNAQGVVDGAERVDVDQHHGIAQFGADVVAEARPHHHQGVAVMQPTLVVAHAYGGSEFHFTSV